MLPASTTADPVSEPPIRRCGDYVRMLLLSMPAGVRADLDRFLDEQAIMCAGTADGELAAAIALDLRLAEIELA